MRSASKNVASSFILMMQPDVEDFGSTMWRLVAAHCDVPITQIRVTKDIRPVAPTSHVQQVSSSVHYAGLTLS